MSRGIRGTGEGRGRRPEHRDTVVVVGAAAQQRKGNGFASNFRKLHSLPSRSIEGSALPS